MSSAKSNPLVSQQNLDPYSLWIPELSEVSINGETLNLKFTVPTLDSLNSPIRFTVLPYTLPNPLQPDALPSSSDQPYIWTSALPPIASPQRTPPEVTAPTIAPFESQPLDVIPPALQPADLVGISFNVLPGIFPNAVNAGGSFNVDYQFQNSGDIAAGSFKVKFYLSTNSIISTFDFLLDTVTINGLSGKTIGVKNSINLTLPGSNNAFWASGDGDYFIGMVIDTDNDVFESNETNNDSVALELDYDTIKVSNTRLANLRGKDFNVNPEPLKAGDKFNFDFDIENLGGATNGDFEVSFYLSKDSTIATTDKFLVKTTVSALLANSSTGSRTMTADLTLPGVNDAFWSGDGTYYIGMIIDSGNAITETNELDNRNRGFLFDYDDVLITGTRLANLRGKDFNVNPEPLKAGDKFNFDFDIENLGGATNGDFEVSFYLSKDSTIATTDKFLVKTTVSALLANSSTGSRTMTADLTLPGVNDAFWAGDGTYYIGMIIDSGNAITETNELDNRNRGFLFDYDDVLITGTQRANLRGKLFDVNPEPLNAGDKFNFDFEIENLGGATNGNYQVSFYLSKDGTIDTGDYRLLTSTLDALAANGTTGRLTLTADLTLPGLNAGFWSGDGTYYIGMIIDSGNAITETNELDNRNRGLNLDLDSVVISNTSLVGTRDNDDMTGTAGDDIFYGRRGDDDLSGLAGNDILNGERGDDNLYGGLGNDKLYGNEGDDFLYGIDFTSTVAGTNSGAGEIDLLNGGFGNDTFFLGSSTQAYYSSSGNNDYALLEDFNAAEDVIMLNGSAGNYRIFQTAGSLPSGSGIYRNNELIAIVQGSSNLNLSSSYFNYF